MNHSMAYFRNHTICQINTSCQSYSMNFIYVLKINCQNMRWIWFCSRPLCTPECTDVSIKKIYKSTLSWLCCRTSSTPGRFSFTMFVFQLQFEGNKIIILVYCIIPTTYIRHFERKHERTSHKTLCVDIN